MALNGHADAAAAVHKLIGAMMVLFDGKRRSKVGLTLALPRPRVIIYERKLFIRLATGLQHAF